jgi:hypothetical protein
MSGATDNTGSTLLALFGCCLPWCLAWSMLCVRALGFLGDSRDRSPIVRVLSRPLGAPRRRVAIGAGGLLVFGNVPAFISLMWPLAGAPVGLFVAFFVVEALWFLNLAFDIARARGRRGRQ